MLYEHKMPLSPPSGNWSATPTHCSHRAATNRLRRLVAVNYHHLTYPLSRDVAFPAMEVPVKAYLHPRLIWINDHIYRTQMPALRVEWRNVAQRQGVATLR